MIQRSCFIHVGIVKTGSSAIQYALVRSLDALHREGYEFPDLSNNFAQISQGHATGGNASALRKALHKRNLAQALGTLGGFANNPRHLILSNEGLYKTSTSTLCTFADGLRTADYTPKCLVMFRPQTELAVSAYLQRIKTLPETRDLDQYAMDEDFEKKRNWFATAKRLEEAFGFENLTVKWLPSVRRRGGVVPAAFDWLGLPSPDIDTPMVNPTAGREAFAILRLLSAHNLVTRRLADALLLQAYKKNLLGDPVGLSSQVASYIHDATRESNEALLRRYCPELSSENELGRPKINLPTSLNQETIKRLSEIAKPLLVKDGKDEAAVDRVFASLLAVSV